MIPRLTFLIIAFALLAGCAASQPKNTTNICKIFEEKGGWYDAARDSSKKWGSPIPIMMAIMHQESRFKSKAKPPRTKILWIFPGPRPSTAFGYSQALNSTWKNYKRSAGNYGADRDDFDDAIDFIGWYNHVSHQRSKIKVTDTYSLYLAYHEGHGGFNRRTYKKKVWLKKVAKKVSANSRKYAKQLAKCEKRLQNSWWWPF